MPTPRRAVALTTIPRELIAAKDGARAAYADAKRQHAAADVLCDRWLSETLLAADGAPMPVQAVMWSRTESLFRLLIDRRCWLAERDAQGRIVADAN
jgi:hypothetical protein